MEKERIRRDLLTLRNNVVFAFFMTTAVWIALFMQLEILQNELKDHMFVHIPRIDNQGYLSFQPLGLIFLSCFSIILIVQFLGMFLHRWGTFLHTLSITNLGIGSHQKEQEKVKEIIIRVSELQKLRNIELEPEPDYDEPLPDYLDNEIHEKSTSNDTGCHTDEPQPDYDDDPAQEVNRRPAPPSYHTDEVHRRGIPRSAMFDRNGYLEAFALENAFERRLRNTIQKRKPVALYGSRTSMSVQHSMGRYPEHRVNFHHDHRLVKNSFTQGNNQSNLYRYAGKQDMNGITRF
ncbi:chitin synthase [Elysia marginata]|uniref:Chitin synthase n=1 Tax=Elysia marginata TaxID=1093978 RepID=A0AAV4HAN8_9GAST|nr:chitin synthase [Elysia marginata]